MNVDTMMNETVTPADDVTETIPSTPSPTSKTSSNSNGDSSICCAENIPMKPKPVTPTPPEVTPLSVSAPSSLKHQKNTSSTVPSTPSPLKSSENKVIITPDQVSADQPSDPPKSSSTSPSLKKSTKTPLVSVKRQMAEKKKTIAKVKKQTQQEKPSKPKKTRCTTGKQTEKWNLQYQEAKQFAAKHGHCMIPNDYKENRVLSAWAKRQRYQYQIYQKNQESNGASNTEEASSRASNITPERIKLLEDIGFCWHHKDQRWWQRYRELEQFVQQRGHAIVPTHFDENQELAGWVKVQRRQFKLYKIGKPSSMTQERVELLDKLGMVWVMKERNLDPNKKKQPKRITSSRSIKRSKSKTVKTKSKAAVKKKKTMTKRKYQKKAYRVNRKVKNDDDSEADSVEAEEMERAASAFYPKSPPPEVDSTDEDSWMSDKEEEENQEPNGQDGMDIVVEVKKETVTDEKEAILALLSFGG